MSHDALMVAGIVLFLGGLSILGWRLSAGPAPEPEPEAPAVRPEDCAECGEPITGPTCKVVDTDEDPLTGEGFAMVAYFHPGCCPVIDPAHVHAGQVTA